MGLLRLLKNFRESDILSKVGNFNLDTISLLRIGNDDHVSTFDTAMPSPCSPMSSISRVRVSPSVAGGSGWVGLAVIEGAKPPSSASEASREGIQRPHVLFSCESASLLPRQSKRVVRCSPRFRRCSNATKSVHRRLWPSVNSVGVGHSEPPVKGNRLRSLEPLWGLFLHVPTQKQEAPPSTSEGWVSPSAVGWGSSQFRAVEGELTKVAPSTQSDLVA